MIEDCKEKKGTRETFQGSKPVPVSGLTSRIEASRREPDIFLGIVDTENHSSCSTSCPLP